ncbi:hypothetical protein LCGC14_1316480 [marine sediment metagenome]|uniref:Uncharacterized protein n=1 Tax=marine sediment metagenome TaxID=412755 RepID=A0A0F9N1L0_9ZZZZ
MRFVNNGPHRRIPIGPSEKRRRVGLNPGQEIDLPEDVGMNLGLDRVTEGKIGKTKVETKQFEKLEKNYTPDDLFYDELRKIKVIGPKTAEDIVEWGTREKLIEAIKSKDHLPFRDDVAWKLRRKYGKK